MGDHEALDLVAAGVDAVEDGEHKDGGLAGSRFRLADELLALQRVGKGLSLD